MGQVVILLKAFGRLGPSMIETFADHRYACDSLFVRVATYASRCEASCKSLAVCYERSEA